jgi:hypothetical protein
MAVPCKAEMSALDFEERELIRSTHHPDIGSRSRADLQNLQARVREMREKEKSLARRIERDAPVKPGTGPGTGTVVRPYQRKQIFASALKRLNNEVRRLKAFEARGFMGERAREALTLRCSRQRHAFSAGPTPNEGVRPIPSDRRQSVLPRAKIGSVSQQTKRAQAQKDAAG